MGAKRKKTHAPTNASICTGFIINTIKLKAQLVIKLNISIYRTNTEQIEKTLNKSKSATISYKRNEKLKKMSLLSTVSCTV